VCVRGKMHPRRRYKPRDPVRAFHGQTNYERRMEAWLMGYIQHEKQMRERKGEE
jgi:hypothetical protein